MLNYFPFCWCFWKYKICIFFRLHFLQNYAKILHIAFRQLFFIWWYFGKILAFSSDCIVFRLHFLQNFAKFCTLPFVNYFPFDGVLENCITFAFSFRLHFLQIFAKIMHITFCQLFSIWWCFGKYKPVDTVLNKTEKFRTISTCCRIICQIFPLLVDFLLIFPLFKNTYWKNVEENYLGTFSIFCRLIC